MGDRHQHITGSDLNGALAGANAPSEPAGGETLHFGDAMITVNENQKHGSKVYMEHLEGGTDGQIARQANADSTIIREYRSLTKAYESYHDEDGNVKPGYERQVEWSQMKMASMQAAAELADVVAHQAEQSEQAEALAKRGRAKAEAAAVDKVNEDSYVRNHRAVLTINGQRR
ncbi:MAG: hypothetical protein NXH95_03205 [Pseudomonadaceae bacterium]|nr:hypothetical protein [Pseudomonadaceae bacterium]